MAIKQDDACRIDNRIYLAMFSVDFIGVSNTLAMMSRILYCIFQVNIYRLDSRSISFTSSWSGGTQPYPPSSLHLSFILPPPFPTHRHVFMSSTARYQRIEPYETASTISSIQGSSSIFTSTQDNITNYLEDQRPLLSSAATSITTQPDEIEGCEINDLAVASPMSCSINLLNTILGTGLLAMVRDDQVLHLVHTN